MRTTTGRAWLTNAVHVAKPTEHALGHLADAVVMDAELHQGAGQVGRDLHQVVLGDVELLQAAFSWAVHLGEALRPSCPRTCPVVPPPWDETWFSLDTHRCLSKPE